MLAAGSPQTGYSQNLLSNGSLNPTDPLPTYLSGPDYTDIPQFEAISSPHAEVIPSWHQRYGDHTSSINMVGQNGDQKVEESSADIWGANGRWMPSYTSTQSAIYEPVQVSLSPDGGFFIGTGSMTLPSGTAYIEGIYQNVTGLQIGETYQVGFYSTNLNGRYMEYIDTYSEDYHDFYARRMEGVGGTYSLLIDGVSVYTGLNNGYVYANNAWVYNSFTFVAQTTELELMIQIDNPPAGSSTKEFYGGIDGVSLSQVPEPSIYLLSMLVGVPALCRRRRA